MDHSTKTCNGCGLALPLTRFIKRTDTSGYQSRCKACVSRYNAERYQRLGMSESQSRWYSENSERARAASKRWKAANPDRRREYKARRRAQVGSRPAISAERTAARLEYFGNRCWMCGATADTLDHVKPLSKGGPHSLSNIRPACLSCNSRKRDKWFGVAQLSLFRR